MPMSGVAVLAVSPGGHLGAGGDDPYRGDEPGGVVVAGAACLGDLSADQARRCARALVGSRLKITTVV